MGYCVVFVKYKSMLFITNIEFEISKCYYHVITVLVVKLLESYMQILYLL